MRRSDVTALTPYRVRPRFGGPHGSWSLAVPLDAPALWHAPTPTPNDYIRATRATRAVRGRGIGLLVVSSYTTWPGLDLDAEARAAADAHAARMAGAARTVDVNAKTVHGTRFAKAQSYPTERFHLDVIQPDDILDQWHTYTADLDATEARVAAALTALGIPAEAFITHSASRRSVMLGLVDLAALLDRVR